MQQRVSFGKDLALAGPSCWRAVGEQGIGASQSIIGDVLIMTLFTLVFVHLSNSLISACTSSTLCIDLALNCIILTLAIPLGVHRLGRERAQPATSSTIKCAKSSMSTKPRKCRDLASTGAARMRFSTRMRKASGSVSSFLTDKTARKRRVLNLEDTDMTRESARGKRTVRARAASHLSVRA